MGAPSARVKRSCSADRNRCTGPRGGHAGDGRGAVRRDAAGPRRGPPPYTPRSWIAVQVGCLFEVLETLVLTLVIFFVIQTFIAQPYRVQQQSMERTLEPGQYVLVDKLTPRFDAYKRGDIVVFNPPRRGRTRTRRSSSASSACRRHRRGPGRRARLRQRRRARRALHLQERRGRPRADRGRRDQSWVVPAGELFVMGDHRQSSADSRVFGTIPRADVIGRAFLRYWPISTFGILQTPTYPDLQPATS